MTENKKEFTYGKPIATQLTTLTASRISSKVSIHTVRDTRPTWDVSDFHHYDSRKCNESSRVCVKCFSLKKLIRFGRKNDATIKACRVFFQLLARTTTPKQIEIFEFALAQYKALSPQERGSFKRMYREHRKFLDVQIIGMWNNVQKSDKISDHKNVQRLCQVERMCRDFEELEAQGMAFEHQDGDGNCENHFTLCKYCISPFRVKLILREFSYAKALFGFIASILKTESYFFCVGMLDDLCKDPQVKRWLSIHLPRYEDQFPGEILEWVRTYVYPKLEAQMLRNIVSQVTAGAFDNLPPINVAPIRIELPAVDRVSAMMHDALTRVQSVLPARSVGLITLLAELCSDSPLSSKIRCVIIYMTSFDCTGILINTVGSQFAKSLAQVFEGMCNQARGLDREELVAQGAAPFDESAFIGTIKLLMAMVPGLGTFEVQEQSQRVKKLEMIAKMVTSWDKLYQFAEKFITMAYEATCEHLYGVSGSLDEMAQAERDIQEWAKQVVEYYDHGGLHKVAMSVGDAEMVSGWKQIGDRYLTRLMVSSKNRSNSFMSAFRTIHAMVDRLWNACAHFHKNDKLREEPVMVYIFGKPGVGKSMLINPTITTMMNRVDALDKRTVPFQLAKNLYVRNEDEIHWNGFVPSEARVVLFDDAFQMRTEEAVSSIVHDIIRMHNITTFPLNMADLDSKAKTPFLASLVVFTSNIRPSRNDIQKVANSPDAILRRFTVVIEQCVKPEYANVHGHIDSRKVREAFPPLMTTVGEEEKMVWDQRSFDEVYYFNQYNQTGNIIRVLNYTEYINLLIETYMVQRKWGAVTRNTIEHIEQEARRPVFGPQNLEAEGWREWCGRKVVAEEIKRTESDEHEVFQDAMNFITPERYVIDALGEVYVRAQLTSGATWHTLMEVYWNLKEYAMCRGVLLMEAHDRHKAWREKVTSQLVDGATQFLQRIGEMPFIKVGLAILGGIAMVFGVRHLMGTAQPAASQAEATFSGDPRTRKHVRKLKVAPAVRGEATFSGDPKTRKHVRPLKVQSEGKEVQAPIDLYPTICGGKLSVDGEYQVSTVFEHPDDIEEMHAEASSDPNAVALAVSKLSHAVVDITARYDYGEKTYAVTMKAVHIGGRLMLAPAHLLHGAPHGLKDGEITISRGIINRRTFAFSELEFDLSYQEEKDIVVIVLPKRMPPSVDLTKNFHDEDSVGEYQMTEGFMYKTHGEVGYILNYTPDLRKREGRTSYALVDKDGTRNGHATIVNGYEYAMPTAKGDCGSPIVWMNSRLQNGRILGIHVAGMTNLGVSNALTCQFIRRLHNKHKTIMCVQPAFDITVHPKLVANSLISENPGVDVCGRVDSANGVRSPIHSKIRASPLHGIFDVETAPAPLCSFRSPTGEWIKPALIAISKMVAAPVTFPPDVAELATRSFSHAICNMTSSYKPHVLSLHQAVNGTKTDYIVPMDMHTSPGYPWILERALRKGAPAGKFAFVSSYDGIEYYLADEVVLAVERRIECARQGIVPLTLFVDQMKDERRPVAKAETGRTRLFNVGPWDLNLALRMYTSSFMAHVMANHVYGEISVGLNVHSDEWGMVYRQFTNNGTNWVGGDYGNYDKTLSYQLLMKCCDVINDWYDDGEENKLIRETLFATCFSAYHLIGRDVYRVEQGNPSGIALTAIINSMVNAIMFRIVFILNGGDITQYANEVCVKFYGDDNIGTVSDNVAHFMNMRTLERTLASFGVEYTTPSKKTVDSEFLETSDITYLKRSFRLESGRVFAPLAMTSIREMLMWVRESMSDEEALVANWIAATMEMFHYGRDAYEEFVNYVWKSARERKVKLPFVIFQISGKYWGAEDKIDVNLLTTQTDQRVGYCYQSGEYIEESLIAQSKTCASENIGRSAPAPRIVEYRAVNTSTANPTTTEQTPTLQSGAPTMSQDTVTTRNELMSFADTSLVTNTIPQDVPSVPPTKIDPYLKESLTAFLQRTYYYNATWQSTQNVGELILRIHLPNYLFSIPQVWDKLKNFAYFRAGVKFGLRMNGSKFHYGSMLVSWAPMIVNTGTYNTGTNNVFSASGNPSFVISPSENEVHEFEMPYALPYPYIPLEKVDDPCFHLGCVSLYVLTPVSLAGTATDVDFTIFMNFTDVDIAGYTPSTYPLPTQVIQNQTNFPALLPGAPALDPPEELEAQGKITRVDREAKEKSQRGIISGVAESIGNVAASLTVVPEVGVFAGAVSGIAHGIASVARYLGYSMPNSLASTTTIRKHYHNLSTTHGLNDSDVLAIDPENGVGSCAMMMGSKAKSMDLLSIIQTPCLLDASAPWQSTWESGFSLYDCRINPLRLVRRDVSNSFETFLSYTSRAFTYWRGSVRIHLSVVCSQMHVGRLQITWVPSCAVVPLPTANNVASSITRIIDIEKETEVDFTIPYLRDQMWLATNMFDATMPYDNGVIIISVLNSLNYPSFPVPPVYFNLWVSAGSDFQLARPDLQLTRYPTYNKSDYPAGELEAQGITREMIKEADAQPLMPGTGSLEIGHAMGEVVSDIKELILRPCQWRGSDVAFGVSYTNDIMVTPFGGVRNVDYISNPNYLQYFSRIFRYSRGSFTNRLIPLSDVNFTAAGQTMLINAIRQGVIGSARVTGIMLDAQRESSTAGVVLPVIGNLYEVVRRAFGTGSAVTVTRDQPLAATVPYYASQPFQVNFGNPNSIPENINNLVYRYGGVPAAYGTCTQGFVSMVAAADDFEFGFLVGPPVIKWNVEPPP